jgi:hypothetical protein
MEGPSSHAEMGSRSETSATVHRRSGSVVLAGNMSAEAAFIEHQVNCLPPAAARAHGLGARPGYTMLDRAIGIIHY